MRHNQLKDNEAACAIREQNSTDACNKQLQELRTCTTERSTFSKNYSVKNKAVNHDHNYCNCHYSKLLRSQKIIPFVISHTA